MARSFSLRRRDLLRRGVIYSAAYVGPLGGLSVLTFAPTLFVELGATLTDVLMAITLFMVPFTIGQLFSGTLSDLFPRRQIFGLGMVLTAITALGTAVAWDVESFLFFRTINGLGYAFVSPVIVALLGDLTTHEDRGDAMGVMGAAVTLGIAIGPLLGGALDALGFWRLTFVYIAAHTAGTHFLFLVAFRDYEEERADLTGAEAFFGFIDSLGIVVRSNQVLLLAVAGAMAFVGMIGVIAFVPDTLSRMGYGPIEVGIVLSMTGLVGAPSSFLAGRAVTLYRRRRSALMAFIATGVVIFVLSLALPYEPPLPVFIVAMGALGAALSLVWAAALTLSVEQVPGHRGTSSSFFQFSRFLGFSLTPMMLTPAYDGAGLRAVLALATGAIFIGAAAVMAMSEPSGSDQPVADSVTSSGSSTARPSHR